MSQKITPFLWFDRQAEDAINFYISVFNGNPAKKKESKLITMKRYPNEGLEGPMKGFEGKVLTGVFELDGQEFMALDGGPYFKFNEAVSLLVDCKDQAEIDYFWDKLSAVPESEQCGWLKDKFGLSWQIVPPMDKWLNGPDNEGSRRATHAMLQMKKIVIADLEKAYKGE
jgi:predicted 3-demethylubiquinone-9 3-methyltransferase (glyoxalase superfamily)